jgi:bacterioferritin (cytochrome b1)
MNSTELVDVLNRLLEAELMALEFYHIHAEAIPEEEIAEGVSSILPAEQAHAATLAARITELGGVPVRAGGQASARGREMGEISRNHGTMAMLRLELEQEQHAIKDYAVVVADLLDDMETLEMLEEQLFDEMRHAKWLKQTIMELTG